MESDSHPPRFVVFEGVDGTGKTTFAQLLTRSYQGRFPESSVLSTSFPGSTPGTLGEFVYRLHHGQIEVARELRSIAWPALQLLHVAAHVDSIVRTITPVLEAGGYVILDRYWWSTYAYVRRALPPSTAWSLVGVELPFWEGLPRPAIIYLEREDTLKPDEVDVATHATLKDYYRELVDAAGCSGGQIFVVPNDDSIEDTWRTIANHLKV